MNRRARECHGAKGEQDALGRKRKEAQWRAGHASSGGSHAGEEDKGE